LLYAIMYMKFLILKHHLGCRFASDAMRSYTACNHDAWLEDSPGQCDAEMDPFKSHTASTNFIL